jgi:hypothetical protein
MIAHCSSGGKSATRRDESRLTNVCMIHVSMVAARSPEAQDDERRHPGEALYRCAMRSELISPFLLRQLRGESVAARA